MNKYCDKILKYINRHSSKSNPIDGIALFKKVNFDENTYYAAIKQLENENKIVNTSTYDGDLPI